MENKVYYGEYSLAYWVELILTKQIILPKYQRYFVWNMSKLKNLMDSISNNRFVPPVTIGSFVKDGQRFNYIIDGQQRLTSILLAYLNRFPNRDIFKAKDGPLAGSSVSLDESDDTNPLDDVLHWRFDNLTEKGDSPEEILKVLDSKQYVNIYDLGKESIRKSDFGKFFLGFSYIVPSKVDFASQQEYYTKLFRDINQQASPLLVTESRKSLYFAKEGLEDYFEPIFIMEYGITPTAGPKQPVDFCRYLCFMAAYNHTNNVNKVARGYSYDIEVYIVRYISSVVSKEYESLFGDFSAIFSDGNFCGDINRLRETLEQLDIPKSYPSIINMDVYFFGLVYYVLFKHKSIDVNRKDELKEAIENIINELKSTPGHTIAPAQFQYLRKRIVESVNKYREFLLS